MGSGARCAMLGIAFLLVLFFSLRGAAEPQGNPAAPSPEKFAVMDENGAMTVSANDHLLFRYVYQNVPFKPYIKEFFSPTDVNVLLDAPPDHLHHHAIMFAIAVDGVDFWQEAKGPGRQVHRAFIAEWADDLTNVHHGGFSENIDWLKPDTDEALLKERRIIGALYAKDLGATLLTWDSVLELPEGKPSATLTGSHYFGLGMRFIESMNKTGQFINSDNAPGDVVRGEERVTPANWCAYTAEADGKPVTVAMFGHPNNPRAPTTWFTMATPFAYMSATLNLWKEPMTLTAGRLLVLRYGIALWDGRVEAARIDRLYRQWLTWAAEIEKTRSYNYQAKPKP